MLGKLDYVDFEWCVQGSNRGYQQPFHRIVVTMGYIL